MTHPRYVLVLAGGRGERFWPWSTPERPKQLLPLASGGRSLLAATLERAAPVVPPERIVVLTARALVELRGLPVRSRHRRRGRVPERPRARLRFRRARAGADHLRDSADRPRHQLRLHPARTARRRAALSSGQIRREAQSPDRRGLPRDRDLFLERRDLRMAMSNLSRRAGSVAARPRGAAPRAGEGDPRPRL